MRCSADSLLAAAGCYFPFHLGGWRHPAQREIRPRLQCLPWKLTSTYICHSVVFLQLFVIYILFQSLCTDTLAVTFFQLFSFDRVQVAENAIPYEFRKTDFFFFKYLCQLPTLNNLPSFLLCPTFLFGPQSSSARVDHLLPLSRPQMPSRGSLVAELAIFHALFCSHID